MRSDSYVLLGLSALAFTGAVVSARGLREWCGATLAQSQRLISALHARGEIVREGRGRYRISGTARLVLGGDEGLAQVEHMANDLERYPERRAAERAARRERRPAKRARRERGQVQRKSAQK